MEIEKLYEKVTPDDIKPLDAAWDFWSDREILITGVDAKNREYVTPHGRIKMPRVKDYVFRRFKLNRNRAIATAAKIIADDPTLPDELAGALMQMCGAGGAKPYEVTNE
jgi:hypothetical protein